MTAFGVVVERLDVMIGHALGHLDLVERQGDLDLFLELHAVRGEAVTGMGASCDVGHAGVERRQFVSFQAFDLDLVGVITGVGVDDEFGTVEFQVAATAMDAEGGGGGQCTAGLGAGCHRY